jgi:hypothetical protein
MKFSRILRVAKRALETEQGREAGRRLTDTAADAARRAAGEKHSATIDKAHGAARKYLDRDDRRRF